MLTLLLLTPTFLSCAAAAALGFVGVAWAGGWRRTDDEPAEPAAARPLAGHARPVDAGLTVEAKVYVPPPTPRSGAPRMAFCWEYAEAEPAQRPADDAWR